MRRLLVPISVGVVTLLAACSKDEPSPVIEPTSAFQPTGSTGATGTGGATGATAGTPTGIDQLPTPTVAVGLGGLSFTGTRPTSPTLTLTVTVQVKSNVATFISSTGECDVTIGAAAADQLSGAFNCKHPSDESNVIDMTGPFNAAR